MKKVGIIGWRGMVGSVLMERMEAEDDFSKVGSYLFSTSLKGQKAPAYKNCHGEVLDSNCIDTLRTMDIIITCQGGDYTNEIHPVLKKTDWNGLWIDAASSLRMAKDSIIVLDPVNKDQIVQGLNSGVRDFIGGNCTVSLMLMGLGGLFKEGLIEWMTSMTYQAASGGGAKNMMELLEQMKYFGDTYQNTLAEDPKTTALVMEKIMSERFSATDFPQDNFGKPLALSLLPWIDTKVENGQSREEWKAQVEANKILGTDSIIPIDGTCVRVASLRCHSQAFTIKLKKSVDIKTIESIIAESNPWVELVENGKEPTLTKLTPAYASGTLKIPVGRVRKMTIGDDYLNAFSIGDQLLWGAAEPLRRTLLLAIS
jgi:aspartate-semialdehyde dehydrogenase